MRGEIPRTPGATKQEWSQYYRDQRLQHVEVLHAHFVRHRYPRHAHDYPVVALVEGAAASFWYRGAQHTAGNGRVFVINAGEPHTGDPVLANGYVYRVLYPHADYLEQVARDVATSAGAVFFRGPVLNDLLL